jgi:hypothetical protein
MFYKAVAALRHVILAMRSIQCLTPLIKGHRGIDGDLQIKIKVAFWRFFKTKVIDVQNATRALGTSGTVMLGGKRICLCFNVVF